jgi:hypothetical protein
MWPIGLDPPSPLEKLHAPHIVSEPGNAAKAIANTRISDQDRRA